MKKKPSVRLPSHIRPSEYRIQIQPDMAKLSFQGGETIVLDVLTLTRVITLHAIDLQVKSVKLSYPHLSKVFTPSKVSYDKQRETISFFFEKSLPKGRTELSLEFYGKINTQMHGLYRSSHTHEGKEKHLAVTQFEATDARRMFPCIDEPAAKAVFHLTVCVPEDHTVISNTIETEVREHAVGIKAVTFAPTPMMSTYLLALIAGEFEYIEAKTKEGVLVRVFTTPGKIHQAKFALETAKKVLSFFNDYFAIPYPLPTLDLIAVPDFASGAMENWGAITYRETALLFDEEHSSLANKQWVALVIAHEIAHQWFGNLVTMQWWDHLWLNEGFASWIEYVAIDHLFPEWHIWTHFLVQDFAQALNLDSLTTTHPIEVPVHHPSEIREVFDLVSYSKGASVIRMLAEFLGYEVFRDGLRHYLKRHSYANATTEDLWLAFEEVSKKPVRKMMRAWTKWPGHPVVAIQKKGKKLELQQTRFLKGGGAPKSRRPWPIPFSLSINGKKTTNHLFASSRALISLPKDKGVLKANALQTGFYRVQYTPEMWQEILQGISRGIFSAEDRVGILDDAFALFRAGMMKPQVLFPLLQAFQGERDYHVWITLAHGLRGLDTLFHKELFYEDFRAFAREIFSAILLRLGYTENPKESHFDRLLRGIVIRNSVLYGNKEASAKMQDIFNNSISKAIHIPPDLRAAMYGSVAQAGSKKEYEIFLTLYRSVHLHEEKIRLAQAMSAFQGKELISRTLIFSLSNEVKAQDSVPLIVAVGNNNEGRELAWEFFKAKWSILESRYSRSGLLPKLVGGLIDGFTAAAQAREVQNFFKTHKAPDARRTILQGIEKIQANAKCLARFRKEIREWFEAR